MQTGHKNHFSSSFSSETLSVSFAGVTGAAVFEAGAAAPGFMAPFFFWRALTTFMAAFLALGVEAFFSGTKNWQQAEHSTCCGTIDVSGCFALNDGAISAAAARPEPPPPPLLLAALLMSSSDLLGVSNGKEKDALSLGPESLERRTRTIDGGSGG